jgi:hypothetical protein
VFFLIVLNVQALSEEKSDGKKREFLSGIREALRSFSSVTYKNFVRKY